MDIVTCALFLFLLEAYLIERKGDILLLSLFGRKPSFFFLRLKMVLCSRLCVSKAILEKAPTRTLRVLGSSRKEAEIILKWEKMEDSVSRGNRQGPTLRRWLPQKLKGGVDTYCTQVYRAIQSLPCQHSCKRAKNVPPSTKLRQLSHLKIWLMGNPRKTKGTNIHFTPVAYQEGLHQGPGSPERLRKALSPWQLQHGRCFLFFLISHSWYRDAENAVLMYRAPGGHTCRSQIFAHKVWSSAHRFMAYNASGSLSK